MRLFSNRTLPQVSQNVVRTSGRVLVRIERTIKMILGAAIR